MLEQDVNAVLHLIGGVSPIEEDPLFNSKTSKLHVKSPLIKDVQYPIRITAMTSGVSKSRLRMGSARP